MTSFLKNFNTIRYFFGAVCLSSIWIFPFSEGPSRDALQQIYGLGMISFSALLFGMAVVPIGVTAFSMSALMCMLFVSSPYLGGRVAGISAILLFFISCGVGANLKKQDSTLKWVLIAVVVAAIINAIEGILQWIGLAGQLYPWVIDTETRGLAFGVFRQRNLFATFLVVGIICTIWLKSIEKFTEYFSWFLMTILVFSLAASASRSGMLESISILIIGLLGAKRRPIPVTRLMIGQFIIYFIATFLLPVIAVVHGFDFSSSAERVASTTQYSRFLLWSNVIEMIKERPWSGWGWLDFGYGHYATSFENRFSESILHHAHNFPLQIAVEFGIPVAILFGISVFVFSLNSIRKFKLVNGDDNFLNEFAFLIFLVIFFIHSMLEFPLWYVGFIFLTGLSVGYLSGDLEKSDFIFKRLIIKLINSLIAIILIILSIFAWNQYSEIVNISKIDFSDKSSRQTAILSASDAWLFSGHQQFSALEFIDPNKEYTLEIKNSLDRLLHFSAEPRVIRPLLNALWELSDLSEFNFHISRFCIAFPDQFLKWKKENSDMKMNEYIDYTINCKN